eukprot:3324627-Amphidinium_carterae.1
MCQAVILYGTTTTASSVQCWSLALVTIPYGAPAFQGFVYVVFDAPAVPGGFEARLAEATCSTMARGNKAMNGMICSVGYNVTSSMWLPSFRCRNVWKGNRESMMVSLEWSGVSTFKLPQHHTSILVSGHRSLRSTWHLVQNMQWSALFESV